MSIPFYLGGSLLYRDGRGAMSVIGWFLQPKSRGDWCQKMFPHGDVGTKLAFYIQKMDYSKKCIEKSVYAIYMETLKGFNEETIYLND